MAMVGFDASVKNIIEARKKNKAVSVRCGLSFQYGDVANELIVYNERIRNLTPSNRAVPSMNFLKPPPVTAPRMAGKICITTTFDRAYGLGGRVMMQSIRNHTNCDDVDFKVITADIEVVKYFGSDMCHFVDDGIKSRYKNVAYIPALPSDRYHHSWYRYEMFNIPGYDRVICIDSDCLCVNDISYLFSDELNAYDLISVEDHIVSKVFPKCIVELTGQGANLTSLQKRIREGKVDIQPALIVANKSLLTGEWYKELLAYANSTPFTYSIDEGILNDFIYLKGLKIRLLPLQYDYQDMYEIACPEVPIPVSPIIVHCEESKPFKKEKKTLNPVLHKWHDWWWHEHNTR